MHETKEFMPAVVELATRLRWLVYHTYDSRRSAKGFPDLVMVRDGRLLFVELKSEKGRLTPEQREWMDVLGDVWANNRTVETYVWRPADWHKGWIEERLR